MKYKDSALVLFSGGQDSTTCLYWAINNFSSVRALCFTYGQKHSIEIEIAQKLAGKVGVDFQLLDASVISKLSVNSLTSDIEMDEVKKDGEVPNTFVPGRNLIFLTFAGVIAQQHGIKHIVTGVSEADYSGYPDCRLNFILSANASINLAMDTDIQIHAPLMRLDKSEVWELADNLGVFDLVRNESITCYNGVVADGCGHCPACKLRNEGLQKYLKRRISK